MHPKLIHLQEYDVGDMSDIMFLAWRAEFQLDPASNSFVTNEDVILEKIAQTEERIRLYSSNQTLDSNFDELMELRHLYVNKLLAPAYGGDPQASSYDDLVYSLFVICEELGWELALERINKRQPNRLPVIKQKRGRHWRRAGYFECVKKYAEYLQYALWGNDEKSLVFDELAPILHISSIKFDTVENWHKTMSLVVTPPSDEQIFNSFMKVLNEKNHKYHSLYLAVNKDTDLLLLGSLKALERSLAIGRQQRRRLRPIPSEEW